MWLFGGDKVVNFTTKETAHKAGGKLEVLGELAACVAHEIRNPMTVVKGFLQLAGEQGNAPFKEYEKVIMTEIDRMDEYLEDLLLLANPQAAQHFQGKEEIDLFAEIKTAVKTLQTEAGKEGKKLQIHKQREASCSIFVNRHYLKRITENIIKNAIEASQPSGVIKVVVDSADNRARMRVIDTGTGIPAEKITRLGEPFYSIKEKGTGLGLTICHKLVKADSGELLIKSKEGWGTAVTVSFPMSPSLET
ncbi:hypothetical protein B9K06_06465 [Bacillus sp. OG2]|nr:hypothetical protein B9K06_06465 [Bacillus sp. OG2]